MYSRDRWVAPCAPFGRYEGAAGGGRYACDGGVRQRRPRHIQVIQQRLEVEYAPLECDHYGVGAVAGIEFWQDALHVGLHGPLGDVEFGGNSFV
jgi:hypothetical protein